MSKFLAKQLISVLDSVAGKKVLVMDPELSGPLSLIAEFSLLKEHGVERVFHLAAAQKLDFQGSRAIIYITRPKIKNMKTIADQIKSHTRANLKFDYNLFFVPKRTLICETILEEMGVYGDITLGEYHLDLIPLDDDVQSLELDNAFKEIALAEDMTCIQSLANSIMKFQAIHGLIPKICGKGTASKLLLDMLLRKRKELVSTLEDPAAQSRIFPSRSEYDSMIILDRSVDLVTPMCTQLTYEGLIDEVYGIQTFVELDPALLGIAQPVVASSSTAIASSSLATVKTRKVPLSSLDQLHAQLRDLNFAVVSPYLNQVARRISEDYEGRHQAKSFSEIKEFIGKLGGLQAEHQSLRLHVNLCEYISKYTCDPEFNAMLEVQQNLVAGIVSQSHLDYIDEMIAKQLPLTQVLRLLSLYSLSNDGLKVKQYNMYKRDITQTYGHHHILTFQNLRRVGLLKKQETLSNIPSALQKNVYASLKKSLRLIVDDVDELRPNDISYVYSGFAPISVRLVQIACTKSVDLATAKNGDVGWKGWEEQLKLLPGATFEATQRTFEDEFGGFSNRTNSRAKRTVVVIVGGCTFTEIAALRFLGQKIGREISVISTNLTNGAKIIDSMILA